MASKGTTKYDYGKNGGKDVYGVDAPDSRENEVFETYMDTVKAIILASDGMTSRAIKAELGELNDEQFTSWALDRLSASDEVDAVKRGEMTFYVKAAPREPIKPIVIDREKLKEWKEHQRKYFAAYATGGYELQERA